MTLIERLDDFSAVWPAEQRKLAEGYIDRLSRIGVASIEKMAQAIERNDVDSGDREIACRLAAWLRLHSVAPSIARAIEDQRNSAGLVWAAANAVVEMKASEAVPVLLRVLDNGDPIRQAAAAWALGWTGGSGSLPSLREVAADPNRQVDVRAHATEALGVRSDRESVPVLLDLLLCELPDLRFWAAYSLGQIGDPSALPALERVASNENATTKDNRSVRQEMTDAVAAIRSGGGLAS